MGAIISSCNYTDSYVNNSVLSNNNQYDTFITVDDITYHFYTSFIFSNIIYYKKYIYLITTNNDDNLVYFKFKLFDDVLFNKNKDFYINTYKFVQSETNPKHFIKTINENFEGFVVLDKKYKSIVVIYDNLYLVSCIDVDNYIGVQFTIFSDNDNLDNNKNIPNTLYIHKNIESLLGIKMVNDQFLNIYAYKDYIIIGAANFIIVSIKDIFIKDVYIDDISQCIYKQSPTGISEPAYVQYKYSTDNIDHNLADI